MFGNKIKLDDALYEKLTKIAAAGGYASVDEFITHVLEREVERLTGPDGEPRNPEEEIKKRLQGLGYIE